MKIYQLPNGNNFITLPKSGGTLWKWMIKLYSDTKGIQLVGDILGEGKNVVIVRNPYDRFISGFFQRKYVDELVRWESDTEMLSDFIKWVEEFGELEREELGERDFHIWRQGRILDFHNISSPIIHKVEDLGYEIEEMNKWRVDREPVLDNPIPIIESNMKLLEDLEIPFSGWDFHTLCGIWYGIQSNLLIHHREMMTERMKELLRGNGINKSINALLKDDMNRFGYFKKIV
jgi:hypothetical protein